MRQRMLNRGPGLALGPGICVAIGVALQALPIGLATGPGCSPVWAIAPGRPASPDETAHVERV